MEQHKKVANESKRAKRLPPVHIPLNFERAVQGLLQVDPKGPTAESKATKKKPRPKK